MASSSFSFLLAEPQYLAREGLKSLLVNLGHRVHLVADRVELEESLGVFNSPMLVIDPGLMEDVGDLALLFRRFPGTKVIVMTNSVTRRVADGYRRAGVNVILLKGDSREELEQGIAMACKGRKFYSRRVLDLLLEDGDGAGRNGWLTPSEKDIVRLMAAGLTSKQIAARKCISYHTVMTHRKNIFRKFGVSNSSELLVQAIRNGLIDNIEYHI